MNSASLSLLDGRFSKATIAYRSFLDWNDFLSFKIETLLTEKLKVSGTAWYDAHNSDVTLWSVNLSYFKQSSICLLYTSPSPRDRQKSRMPSSA